MTDPQVIVNLGTGGADLNGENGSTSSADSNDARFLDWPGDNGGNYVYLPGVNPNILTVPQDAAFDILGNVDLRAYVSCDDWTSAQIFINRGSSNATTTYRLGVNASGDLTFLFGDGSTAYPDSSTIPTGFSDGSAHWVRVTRNVSGGELKFYTSDDGSTWSQLGATVSYSTNAPSSVSQQIEIGKYSSTLHTGKVYRAQVLDGIDGTTVLDVDTSLVASGSDTSFTDLTGNHTVTINRSTSGRKSVAVVSPVWLFGTDDQMSVADNALLDIGATDDLTVIAVARTWDNASDRGTYYAKRTSTSSSTGVSTGYWLRNSGTTHRRAVTLDDGSTGRTVVTPSGSELAGRLDVFGAVVDRSGNEAAIFLNGSKVSNTTVNFGSLANADPVFIGRNGGLFNDMELISVSMFRRALTTAEIASLTTYYQNRLS